MFDNVRVACHIPARVNLVADVVGLPAVARREAEMRQRAEEIVELAGLDGRADKLARDLPHGHQRALGVAVALATGPKLLCLDEPVTGMNVEEIEAMMGFIERIHQQGMTILLVEHAMTRGHERLRADHGARTSARRSPRAASTRSRTIRP